MIYLLLGIVSSALVSICMRLSETRIRSNLGMLTVNYLICAVLAALYTRDWAPGPELYLTAGLGVVNGVLYLVSFILLQRNVKRSGVVLPATFMKLGLLVSILVSVCIFKERPGALQCLGFVLAVAAILLINYQKGEGRGNFRMGLIWLLLCGGMADAMSKIYEEVGQAALSPQFLFFTFATALPLCGILTASKGERPGKWEWAFGLLIGIPNFFSSKFLLRALEDVLAVVAYPVYSVATILVVTLTGVVLFRERLEKKQWLGLGMILAALVLLNQ